jgi:Lrp/AsnC family transcriptional regulator, leucine-responsive regulatory protein
MARDKTSNSRRSAQNWRPIDETDRRLLGELVGNGRSTLASLAELVGLSSASVHERLRKLEQSGVIRGYAALIDPQQVGAGTTAFVAFNLEAPTANRKSVEGRLAQDPSVIEIHEVAGDDCYLLKVRTESTESLAAVLNRLRQLAPGSSTRTTIVLRTILERPVRGDLVEGRPA